MHSSLRQTIYLTCAFLLIALCATPAICDVYYVAPSGSDSNPGTAALPWLTIQKAANTLVAGDTVYVKAGTYQERVIPKNSGAVGESITYAAYGNDNVTLDGSSVFVPRWAGLFEIMDKSYIQVVGFKIKNSSYTGILVEDSSHIRIEQNYTYDTFSSGIGVWNCDHVTISNNEVELACNDGDQECITVAGTDTFEISNNQVHHGGPGISGAEGIAAKDGSRNGKVLDNHVHHMNRLGIYVDAWDKHTYNIEVF
ncbi:MAG: right-handed parallel beta-helix repeat-containing protein, partial [Desulforhabdus sp.]|nr:right-handed parallel beta-helix repeat-containing protein [Desulforhabdus sp.]